MSDSSNLASAIADQESANSGGYVSDLFGRLAEGVVDLGFAYAENELLVDEQQAVSAEDSGAAATNAGVPSGLTLEGVGGLPSWALPVAGVVVGVVVLSLIFRN